MGCDQSRWAAKEKAHGDVDEVEREIAAIPTMAELVERKTKSRL